MAGRHEVFSVHIRRIAVAYYISPAWLRRAGCAIQVTDVGPCAVPTFAATVYASVSNRRLFEAGSKGVDLRSNGDKLRSQRGGKPTIRKRY